MYEYLGTCSYYSCTRSISYVLPLERNTISHDASQLGGWLLAHAVLAAWGVSWLAEPATIAHARAVIVGSASMRETLMLLHLHSVLRDPGQCPD